MKKPQLIIEGLVKEGRGIGRSLDFPTANIESNTDFSLDFGVYYCLVYTQNSSYKALLHYGPRPTFKDKQIVIEVFLLDFEGDLYGESIKIEVFDFLRDVKFFKDLSSLQMQMNADLAAARNYFK